MSSEEKRKIEREIDTQDKKARYEAQRIIDGSPGSIDIAQRLLLAVTQAWTLREMLDEI